MEDIISSLHPLERKVFPHIKTHPDFNELVKASGLSDVEVMRALQWLSNKGLLTTKEKIEEKISLDKNGLEYSKQGLPEKRFLKTLIDGEKSQEEIITAGISKEELNVSIGTLKQKAAIDVKKEDNKLVFSITETGRQILEKPSLEEKFLQKEFPLDKNLLEPEEKYAFEALLRRKNMVKLDVIKIKTITLTEKGKELANHNIEEFEVLERLTPEILKNKKHHGKKFRTYDVKINVPKVYPGKRHFVNQAIKYMKQIWLEMGFTEMQGDFVQTAFWDLDALFVPQDHPARSMQDTFYIKDPKSGHLPEGIWQEMKGVHENGGKTGSKGWGGIWSKDAASENLLRTHTTVLSAQYLDKIKNGEYKMPIKFFSVNKVFRNEQVDWKHLFEFNQVEGIVVDPDANLENLKGYLLEFFTKMGFSDVRMKPAHFPYTEPSIQVEVYNSQKDEWIELGGAGIFRPEVTKTLIGKEVPVLAWGIGMERVIVEYFELKDLRDLYTNDIKQIKEMKIWMR